MGPSAELCSAQQGWMGLPASLVVLLCSSPQGSRRVQGCSSVTGPVHRHYVGAPHTLKTWAYTSTHARSPPYNPAGSSVLNEVTSRSLSGLTRHTYTGWVRLGVFFFLSQGGCPSCLFYEQACQYILWVSVSWLCEGHQAKLMKKEAAFEVLSGDKSAVCVFGQSQWSRPLRRSNVEANETRL